MMLSAGLNAWLMVLEQAVIVLEDIADALDRRGL